MPRILRSRGRRLSVLTIVAAATAVGLVGCSASSGTPSKSGAPSGSVSYWYALEDNSVKAKQEYIKYNVTAFTNQNPKVTLNAVEKSPSTIDRSIQVALAAGQGPDIIQTPGTSNAIPYAEAGYLQDLTKEAKAQDWSSKLLPWAETAGVVKGKFVMIPQYYETLVLYYNKTLFKKYGWAPPKSRAQLDKLAKEMEAKGVIPFAAGNASYQPASEWLVSAFMNEVAGPDNIYDALTNKTQWTAKPFADSINLLKKYFDEGYFQGGAKQYFSTTDPQKFTDLADGKAGMYISGSWDVSSMPTYFGANGNKDTWDWAPLPSLEKGIPQAYPLSVGGTLSVNSKSSNPNAADAYLNWIMTDTKDMWAQAAATGQEPLPIKFKPSDIPKSIDPRYARIYTSLQSAPVVGYTTWTSWGGGADTYIVANIDKVINGNMTTDAFLQGVEAAFKSDYSKGLVPPPFKPES